MPLLSLQDSSSSNNNVNITALSLTVHPTPAGLPHTDQLHTHTRAHTHCTNHPHAHVHTHAPFRTPPGVCPAPSPALPAPLLSTPAQCPLHHCPPHQPWQPACDGLLLGVSSGKRVGSAGRSSSCKLPPQAQLAAPGLSTAAAPSTHHRHQGSPPTYPSHTHMKPHSLAPEPGGQRQLQGRHRGRGRPQQRRTRQLLLQARDQRVQQRLAFVRQRRQAARHAAAQRALQA